MELSVPCADESVDETSTDLRTGGVIMFGLGL